MDPLKPCGPVEAGLHKAQHMLIGASGSPPGFGWIFGFFGRFWSVWGPRGTFNPNPEFLPYRLDETDRSALSGGLGEFCCFIFLISYFVFLFICLGPLFGPGLWARGWTWAPFLGRDLGPFKIMC